MLLYATPIDSQIIAKHNHIKINAIAQIAFVL